MTGSSSVNRVTRTKKRNNVVAVIKRKKRSVIVKKKMNTSVKKKKYEDFIGLLLRIFLKPSLVFITLICSFFSINLG